jgi:hypothetical protein
MSQPKREPLNLPEMKVFTDGGPWAEHNHPCAVCRERHSILDLSIGVMMPCRECHARGWFTLYAKPGSLLNRLLAWRLQ